MLETLSGLEVLLPSQVRSYDMLQTCTVSIVLDLDYISTAIGKILRC